MINPSIIEEVRTKLSDLNCVECEITDISADHQGHSGNNGAAHFVMVLVSNAFAGKSLIERERLVSARFKSDIPERIHAIQLRAYTPEEYRRVAHPPDSV